MVEILIPQNVDPAAGLTAQQHCHRLPLEAQAQWSPEMQQNPSARQKIHFFFFKLYWAADYYYMTTIQALNPKL